MVARPAKPFRSANAGEFSPDVSTRIDIKQYYSAGLNFKNIEPVPQSGWRQMGGSRRIGIYATTNRPRFYDILLDDGVVVMAVFTPGRVDFYTPSGLAGATLIPGLTEDLLNSLSFYSEGRTIGLFHPYFRSKRLFQVAPGNYGVWSLDDWPFNPPPSADLGGAYPKTADVWEMVLRWVKYDGTPDSPRLVINVTVDKETTVACELTNTAGTPVIASDPTADWGKLAWDIANAISNLDSVPGGVTPAIPEPRTDNSIYFVFTFGGAAAGEEYQVSAIVSNTSDASALTYHTAIGKTTYPPIFSDAVGWPGTANLIQDRMVHARIASMPGAVAMSKTGEYFDFNVDATTDDAARLDKLRTSTNEWIWTVKESSYVLLFTSRAIYFATNRVISHNEPMNFVQTSEIAAQPNCDPFDLEGIVYYVALNPEGVSMSNAGGTGLQSLQYNDVSTKFDAASESLLASHLVEKIIRTARQEQQSKLDAAKGWLLRTDGRLIAGQIIKNQAITGFCEWIAAGNGFVREIKVDQQNRLWLAVERGARRTIEIYDPSLFLQDTTTSTSDLTGIVSGLSAWDSAQVYAVAEGRVLGPFQVVGGKIDLQDPYTGPILVGRWQAPYFESMPEILVLPDDSVINRPGRIHSAQIYVVDTTSIAVGANKTAPINIPLLDALDPVDTAMLPKTKTLEVTGLEGFTERPTLVITQTKPGPLRVKEYAIGSKL